MEVILIIIVVIAIYFGFNVYKLSTCKIYSGAVISIDPAEIPVAHTDRLRVIQEYFLKEGFNYICHVTRSKVLEGQEWGIYGVVYFNEEYGSYAFVAIEPSIHAALEFRLYFINMDDCDEIYETLSGSDFPPGCYPSTMHLNDAMTLSYDEQWASHKSFLSHCQVSISTQPLSQEKVLALCERVYLSGLIESKAILPRGDTYRISLNVAIVIPFRLIWVCRKLLKQKLKPSEILSAEKQSKEESPIHQLEAYNTYKRIQESNKMSSYGKIILLLVSVILFGISFGLGFGLSFQTLLLLMVVLFVHELGHLFGMWVFGYRDLKMFFVPFLGALASGKKDEVKPWQEAVVLILGPLPGYVVGIALLFNENSGLPDWVYDYAMISLILNAINLLPFMPLDGGRLVNIGLFNKHPYLQLVFYILSIGCFILSGILWGEKIGFVIAGLLLLGLSNLIKEVGFLHKMIHEKVHKGPADPSRILSHVSKEAAWQRLTPQDRWAILDSLIYRVQHAKAGAATSIGIFLMWVAAIVLPIYLSLGDETRKNFGFALAAMSAGNGFKPETIEELEENYIYAKDFREKVKILSLLVTRLSHENNELGSKYWKEMISISNEPAISEDLYESTLTTIARLCYLYERVDCPEIYYQKLVALKLESNIMSDARVNALLYLAEFGKGSVSKRLSYLNIINYGLNDLESPGSIASVHARQSKIYYLLGEKNLSESAIQKAILSSYKYSPELTRYYVIELINLHAHQTDFQSAINVLEKWQPKLEKQDSEWRMLNQDLAYIHVWLLAEVDPVEAKKIIHNIQPLTEVNRIELNLAKFYLETLLHTQPPLKEVENVIPIDTTMGDDYQWSELALYLDSSVAETGGLYGKNGLTFVANRWYSKLTLILDKDHFKELRLKIEKVGSNNY